MPNYKQGITREERVRLSENQESFVHDFKTYIPNGNPIQKILNWKQQGAEIYYLTSRTTTEEIADIRNVLNKYYFPDNQNLLYRKDDEAYKDVAERLMPDILIEDDCESIGGKVEMTYPHIKEEIKSKIKSVVIKEFGGIDHLPNDINILLKL